MSTTEKMTVHKALCELKVIGDRIMKGLRDPVFVVANKHSNAKISGVPVAECCEEMKSAYQSVVDLIARRDAIKRAVVKSNATTNVVVGGVTYTVAEAIEMKNHGMEYTKLLMGKLASDLDRAKRQADIENARLETRGDEYIRNIYNTTDMKSLTAEAVEERKKFIALQTMELVDPLKVSEKIAALEKQYYDFMTDVDAALSVSNATTEIEISY